MPHAAEDGLECPFAELGLITPLTGDAAQFRRAPKPTLPDEVFASALIDFWKARYPRRGALAVETIAHDPGSPGRAFLLDEESVAERLERVGDATRGAILWDEGSGLRQASMRRPEGLDAHEVLQGLYRAPARRAA